MYVQYGALVCSFCREADYDLHPEVEELSAEDLIEIELKKMERAKKKLKKKTESAG